MPIYPCLLPHPSEPRVLLLQGERGWSLPAVETEGGWFAYRVGHIARELSEQLGVEATGLRHLQYGETDFCELENHSSGWTPPAHGRWVGCRELSELAFVDRGQRVVLESWLREVERGEVPAVRPPWERRGWFAEASA